MEAIGWIIAFVILVVIEIATLGLTTIWFAIGALVAFFVALLGANIVVQAILFAVVSVFMLVVTRPIAQKYFNKDITKTNVEGLIGKKAKVTMDISNKDSQGYAIVNGQEWTARAVNDDDLIKKGEVVVIKEISGVKLIVEKYEEVN